MADLGATFTDAEIAKTEKELKAVYNKAYKDILQKQKDFNEKYKIKEEKKLKQVASGQMTQEEFDHWKKGQVFQGKQWENKKKQILGTIYKTNEVATGIVNGKTHNVFAFNANYTAYDLEHGAGVNFGFELYDETTVVNLIKNDPQLLPKWKIDQPKDYVWNQKKLNRQINLGIIEGESLDKIANRLGDALVTQNFNKMRTFARTAMTGAQNSGRQIRLEEAKGLGIKLKKEWMATLDSHTRINHRELDGQKVDTDKEFEVDGIKIRYPGDPQAHPSMVYNCRCTMVGDLENYPATYDRYDNIDGKRIKGMTYKEWEEAKKKGDDISPVPLTYSQIGLYKQSGDLLDLFKDKKMSNLYNEMKATDTKAANQFYGELKKMGKPSEVWQDYIDGKLPDDQLKAIDDMLQKYANSAGLLKKTPDVKELFKDKKMSNVYNEMKEVDKKAANQFYNELKGMGKPSETWQQYMDGTLDKKTADKITALLEQYASKANMATSAVTDAIGAAKDALGKAPEPAPIKDLFGDTVGDLPSELNGKFYDLYYDEGLVSQLKGFPSGAEAWKMYKNGVLPKDMEEKIDDLLTKYAKDNGLIKDVVDTTKTASKAANAVKDIKTLSDAQDALKKAQEAVNKAGADKKFIGIWKDEVTYADYESKKAGIAAKKQYYIDKIAEFESKGITNKQLKQYLADLEEFEANGQAYSDLLKNLEDAKKKVADLSPKPQIKATGKIFSADAFDEKTKKAAHNFTNKREADNFHRQYLDSIWDDLTNEEKYGVWEYTRNSNPMNKSLSGYHDSWSRSSFIGLDKTDWGHEDSWRSLPSNFKKYGKDGHATYHKAILDTTNAIEKSSLPEGVRLVRGSDKSGFAGMIEGDLFSFDQAKNLLNKSESEIKKALEGQVIQNHAFTSTGIASGTGFGGEVAYRIYAPKGTHAIYAEPQSYFGDTVGGKAKLYKKGQAYSSVGGEAEVILQRGTEFRITGVSKSGGTLVVEMEVVAQPDYFKFGDEDTFNAGKTRHKK